MGLGVLYLVSISTIIEHQVCWDPKTTDNVSPHEVLNLVGGYLRNWFNFYSLSEVLNRHHKELHLANCQREKTQDVYSPRMERLGTMY